MHDACLHGMPFSLLAGVPSFRQLPLVPTLPLPLPGKPSLNVLADEFVDLMQVGCFLKIKTVCVGCRACTACGVCPDQLLTCQYSLSSAGALSLWQHVQSTASRLECPGIERQLVPQAGVASSISTIVRTASKLQVMRRCCACCISKI